MLGYDDEVRHLDVLVSDTEVRGEHGRLTRSASVHAAPVAACEVVLGSVSDIGLMLLDDMYDGVMSL